MKANLNVLLRQLMPESVYENMRRIKCIMKGNAYPDWHDHIAQLVKRDLITELPTIHNQTKPKVLFWTPMASWPDTILEYLIAWSLRLRGHEVLFAVCCM